MPTWAAVLAAICGSTGVFNLITTILQHKWARQAKSDSKLDAIEGRIDALMQAQRASMEERIRFLVGYYLDKNEISMATLSNLHDMHRRYVGVGGNGNLDTEIELLDTIPVKG